MKCPACPSLCLCSSGDWLGDAAVKSTRGGMVLGENEVVLRVSRASWASFIAVFAFSSARSMCVAVARYSSGLLKGWVRVVALGGGRVRKKGRGCSSDGTELFGTGIRLLWRWLEISSVSGRFTELEVQNPARLSAAVAKNGWEFILVRRKAETHACATFYLPQKQLQAARH